MSCVAMPQNLRLVLEHLTAVRELDRYLHDKGVEKDLDRYISRTLCPALAQRVPQLQPWRCVPNEDSADWYPNSWKPADSLYLSLRVLLPSPLDEDDPDPSVNIYVKADSPVLPSFCDRSTPCVSTLLEDGFGFAADHGWYREYPVGRYVNWLEADGSFVEDGLLERLALEAEKIVRLEPQITATIRQVLAQPARKKATRQSTTTKSRRRT